MPAWAQGRAAAGPQHAARRGAQAPHKSHTADAPRQSAPQIAKNTRFAIGGRRLCLCAGRRLGSHLRARCRPPKAAMSGGSIGTSPSMGHTRSVETAGSCDDRFFHALFIGIPTFLARAFMYLICCRCFCRTAEKEADGPGGELPAAWWSGRGGAAAGRAARGRVWGLGSVGLARATPGRASPRGAPGALPQRRARPMRFPCPSPRCPCCRRRLVGGQGPVPPRREFRFARICASESCLPLLPGRRSTKLLPELRAPSSELAPAPAPRLPRMPRSTRRLPLPSAPALVPPRSPTEALPLTACTLPRPRSPTSWAASSRSSTRSSSAR